MAVSSAAVCQGGQERAYVTDAVLGTSYNFYDGYVGMKVVVGSEPITVTALGRMMLAGNHGTHPLKLVRMSDGSDVAGGSASVTMTGGTVGQFRYASLATPVVLAAGTAYYVVSLETAGEDNWSFVFDTYVTTTAAALESSGVYGVGPGAWFEAGSAGQTFGPVDFKYASSSATLSATVTGSTATPFSYNWSGPAGTGPFSNAASITVSVPGVYTAAVADANGCTGLGAGVLTINPPATCAVTPPSAVVCAGASQTFAVSASGGMCAMPRPWPRGPTCSK